MLCKTGMALRPTLFLWICWQSRLLRCLRLAGCVLFDNSKASLLDNIEAGLAPPGTEVPGECLDAQRLLDCQSKNLFGGKARTTGYQYVIVARRCKIGAIFPREKSVDSVPDVKRRDLAEAFGAQTFDPASGNGDCYTIRQLEPEQVDNRLRREGKVEADLLSRIAPDGALSLTEASRLHPDSLGQIFPVERVNLTALD